jgi:hypothetical protein
VYDHKIVSGSLMISAGKMPTLAARNCNKQTLTQIQPSSTATANAVMEPRSDEAQQSRKDTWPA